MDVVLNDVVVEVLIGMVMCVVSVVAVNIQIIMVICNVHFTLSNTASSICILNNTAHYPLSLSLQVLQ